MAQYTLGQRLSSPPLSTFPFPHVHFCGGAVAAFGILFLCVCVLSSGTGRSYMGAAGLLPFGVCSCFNWLRIPVMASAPDRSEIGNEILTLEKR